MIDPRDLLAVACIQRHDILAGGPGTIHLLPASSASPDHHHIAVHVPCVDVRFALLRVNQGRATALRVMPLHHHAALGRDLARARVADAVHRGQAVRAVTGQAQATAARRVQPRPQHRHEQVVARLELDR